MDIILSMSEITANSLYQQNFKLYVLRAIQKSGSALPIVTQKLDIYAKILIDFNFNLSIFTSPLSSHSEKMIHIISTSPILLGQTFSINVSGTGTVSDKGPKNCITMINATGRSFSVGLSYNDHPASIFPLYGQDLQLVAPFERAILLLTSLDLPEQSILKRAYGPALLINFQSNMPTNISYDLNMSWIYPVGTIAYQTLAQDEDLVPLLIQSLSAH